MEDWLPALQQARPDAAWDIFLSRYRRLIVATIRHQAHDHDDAMDVFAEVCAKLRADEMRRLRVRAEEASPRAQFSTWLVAVVRNLTIDWVRHRHGRIRASAAVRELPPLQRSIHDLVILERMGHAAAYETIRAREASTLTWHEFQANLREVYRLTGSDQLRADDADASLDQATGRDEETPVAGTPEAGERREIVQRLLAGLPAEDRLAVTLYVLDDLPAAQVAVILGLPGAKSVYNRVYRVLAELRAQLDSMGIRLGDL